MANIEYLDRFKLVTAMGGVKMQPFLPIPAVRVLAEAGEAVSAFDQTSAVGFGDAAQVGHTRHALRWQQGNPGAGLAIHADGKGSGAALAWYWQQGLLKKKPVFLT